MNRFFTLLLAASCLTAVGQSGVCNYPILQVPQVVYLEGNGVWLSASSDDPLIWNVDVIADSILATTCGLYQVQELVDFGFGLANPCALISSIYVVSETCPLAPSSFCGEGTVWEVASSTCIVANPADINNDGCVQLGDLLDLLGAYGTCDNNCDGDCVLPNAASTCVNNECVIVTCNVGYADCNGSDTDGCEGNLLTDINNCGSCGLICDLANATSTCVNGTCMIASCDDGYADYNGEVIDGCEGLEMPSWSCGDPLEYQGYDYETVLIGEQCWFAENLRNENYRSGDAIANNLSDLEWSSTVSGASTVYGEGNHMCGDFAPNGDACDEVFALNEYGRLYNWYAVDSPLGLCPSSWHVASDAEWMDLEMYLGMSVTEVNLTGFRGTNEGTSLKAIAGWFSSGGGDNSSGFSARPGGLRAGVGDTQFLNGGGGTSFWTSSKDPGEPPWFRGLTAVSTSAEQINRNNTALSSTGYSVRCIKDAE